MQNMGISQVYFPQPKVKATPSAYSGNGFSSEKRKRIIKGSLDQSNQQLKEKTFTTIHLAHVNFLSIVFCFYIQKANPNDQEHNSTRTIPFSPPLFI